MSDPVLAAAENNARWCDLICHSHLIPTWMERGHRSLPLVGYEQGAALQAALASGFSEIGSLRVWLRPSKDP